MMRLFFTKVTELKYFGFAAAMICLLVAFGCGKQGEAGDAPIDLSNRTIKAVATTGMIGDAVKNIGKGRVEVVSLMGPGIDPHLYKASEGDVTRMAGADIIFYNGLHLEGKMAEVFEKMQQRHIKTVAVAANISEDRLITPPEYAGNFDPHIWFDVKIWHDAVKTVYETLVSLDPVNKTIYAGNWEQYSQTLRELDDYVRRQAATVEKSKRVLVTAHDAFNYFGRAYDFEVRGLQGISTAAETGTADVQDLADFIVARKIPAIFVETSVPPRYIEALQAAVQSKGFGVNIGGYLFSDAMGNPGTPEGEYPGMVRKNIDTIVSALTKTAAITRSP